MRTEAQAFVNGRVFTGRGEDDFVSAFVIEDGRFTWVGDSREIVAGAGAIDLGGRTVIPGLIDVHTHPSWIARTLEGVPCTAPVVRDIDGMVAALRRHPNFGGGPDAWIEGFGYDEWGLAERRAPTAADLDRVTTTQPVFVMRSDCHSGVCNTRALELAGITRETPDPEGGRIGRYPDGTPNGLLEEHAASDLVLRVKSPTGHAARVAGISALGAHYAARGIVAVTEMMALARPLDDLRIYRDAERRGFPQQAAIYFDWVHLSEAGSVPDLTDAERTGRTRFAGVKLFADGSVSGRTAWMATPYRGSDASGYPTVTDEQLESAHAWAVRNGVQVAVHAMGDRAIGRIIEFFADREPWMPSGTPSVRLEHVTMITPEQQRRMREGRMTFGASTQIIFLYAEHEAYASNLTPERLARAYPLREAYAAIEHLGLSSDAPATTWADPDDVFVSIMAAVIRRTHDGAVVAADQAITVPQAVLLYTARAATVAPFDGSLGRIAPGYEGSFVVLDRDIFSIAPDEIDRTGVEQTWIAGRQVFGSD